MWISVINMRICDILLNFFVPVYVHDVESSSIVKSDEVLLVDTVDMFVVLTCQVVNPSAPIPLLLE